MIPAKRTVFQLLFGTRFLCSFFFRLHFTYLHLAFCLFGSVFFECETRDKGARRRPPFRPAPPPSGPFQCPGPRSQPCPVFFLHSNGFVLSTMIIDFIFFIFGGLHPTITLNLRIYCTQEIPLFFTKTHPLREFKHKYCAPVLF